MTAVITELHPKPYARHDSAMSKTYLSLGQFADRVNMKSGALSSYKDKLPEPDVIIGTGPRATRGWSEATIDKWNEARPGTGNAWAKSGKK